MAETTNEGVQIKVAKDSFIGTVLEGRYEVLELVGKGAMGSLYRGKHNALDRPVAIKFLHSHLAEDDVHMQRFAREAKLAATLNHPNLVHVYDVGNAPDGSPYLVMDFLDGKSLAQLVKEMGAFPAKRALPVFIQIAQGLQHAHSRGLLHRDLKLSNIMLVNEGTGETAKIIDFGIAKSMDPEQAGDLTATGEIFGSPLYMSPEQLQGHQLDQRSDIYSFGCVMYQVLTGVPPYEAPNMVALIYKHVNEKAAPMSEVSPGLKLPPRLEDLVFRCLEKDPAKRFADAAEIEKSLLQIKNEMDASAKAAAAAEEAEYNATRPVQFGSPVTPSMVPSDQSAQQGRSRFGMIMAVMALIPIAVLAYVFAHKNEIPGLSDPWEQPRQKQGEVYNGDDSAPVVWHNPAAANQPAEVLLFQTHQTTDQPRSKDINYEFTGHAKVHIGASHRKPVYVVLSGFAPIDWKIQTDPGVKIEKVILNGYLKQKITGLEPSIPVVEASGKDEKDNQRTANSFEPFTFPDASDPTNYSEFPKITEEIKQQTNGNQVSSSVVYGQTHKFDI